MIHAAALLLLSMLSAEDDRLWVHAVKDNGRWLVMESGKPLVYLTIGDEAAMPNFITYTKETQPLRGKALQQAWENRSPGVCKVRYPGGSK